MTVILQKKMKIILILITTLLTNSMNAQAIKPNVLLNSSTDNIENLQTLNIQGIVQFQSDAEQSKTINLDSITLQHSVKEKTVDFQVGELVKVKGHGLKVKGRITSISNGVISIKPKKKKATVVEDISVKELRWIKKYNHDKSMRSIGVLGQTIGTTGTVISVFFTYVVMDAVDWEWIFPGTAITAGTVAIHLGGYYLQGSRKYIEPEKWQLVEN